MVPKLQSTYDFEFCISKPSCECSSKNYISYNSLLLVSISEKAKQILRENDDKLTRLANCLIEKETVYKKEFEAIYNGDYDPNSFKDEKINIF